MANSRIGQRLKLIRENKKLPQKKIAEKLGVSRSTILNYEGGKNPPDLAFVMRFCREYGINSNWLLFGRTPIYLEGDEASLNESALELYERLTSVIDKTDPGDIELPPALHVLTEAITADTPENYLRLLKAMKEHEDIRRQIFINLYLLHH